MRVLLIAYYYPPMGGAGVQRVLKMSRYLGDFGVQLVVLVAHDPGYVSDASLLAEIPASVEVHRVEHRTWLSRWLARRAAAPGGAPASKAATPGWRRLLRDTALSIYAALSFPDDKRAWADQARRTGRRLLAQQGFDLILSSAPPMSVHALACQLSRESGLPWVADYRDLWVQNPGYLAPRWRAWWDNRTEQRWLRQAAGVVTVTPSWHAQFQRLCGLQARVAFIPNGYDEKDFAAPVPRREPDGCYQLVHTGTFYGPRDPGRLLDALELYLRDPLPGAPELRLRLVGNIGQRFAAPLAEFQQRHPGVVELQAYLPHSQALQQMRQADALLLVVGSGSSAEQQRQAAGTLPGKLFEYLRAGAPILVLGDPQGDAARLAAAHARCWIADETDSVQIAAMLRQMLAAAGPAPLPAQAAVDRFERRALAAQMADFLRECMHRAARS